MSDWLPWQETQRAALMSCLARQRFPHALLLSGRAGLGKQAFARHMAHALVCQQRNVDGDPCGQCRGCQLYAAQTHPDVREVTLLDDKKLIGVDQVREIGDYLSLKSQFGGYKVVVLTPADRLNANGANALLKTLEEPPPLSVLMLVTARPAALPPTVRSRCQQIAFAPPATAAALAWLQPRSDLRDPALALRLCGGAPLAAVEIATGDWLDRRMAIFTGFERVVQRETDPVNIAAEWLKFDPMATIYCLYSWITDMIRLTTGTTPESIVNRDLAERLQRLAGIPSPRTLFEWLDKVTDAWRNAESQLNTQLLFEDLLITWYETGRTPGPAAR